MLVAREIIITLSILNKGNWEHALNDIKNHRALSEDEVREALKEIPEDVKTCTILDSDYPETFKQKQRPPLVLFYKGDLSLIKNENILGVTGKMTKEGEEILNNLLKEKFCRVILPSNLTENVKVNPEFVAVVSKSMDDAPEGFGLAISEALTGKGDALQASSFISKISKNVFVPAISDKEKSKFLIIHLQTNSGNILCLPGKVGSGTNAIIKAGGILIEDADDIKKEF